MRNQFSILSLIVFIATVAFLSQQSNAAVVTIIDNFTPDTTALSLTRPSTAIPADASQFTNGNETLGTERDLLLHVDAISVRAPVNAYLLDGLFNIAFASGTSGYGGIQYDGVDGLTTLSYGLGNIDLTQDLSAYAFTLSVQADHPTTFTINVYTSASLFSTFNFVYTPIDPEAFVDLVVPFTSFIGNVNFQNVNAIELYINATTTVGIDAAIEIFGLFGYQISGFAFIDCDSNGSQGVNESDLVGASVTLRNTATNTVVDTTLTDNFGDFDFFGVVNGTYSVCVTNSIGATFTTPSNGCRSVTLQNAVDVFGLSYGFLIATSISVPGPVSLECGSCTTPVTCLQPATATGCGGTSTVTFDDTVSTNVCPKIITRTWSVVGNSNIKGTQTITVTDTVFPLITNPAQNVSTSCSAPNPTISSWVASNANATATDCNGVSFTNNWNGQTPTTCTSTVVIFTANDPCGHQTPTTGTYTIFDSVKPTWSPVASNAGTECTSNGSDLTAFNNWLNTRGGAQATDDCTTAANIVYSNDYTGGFTSGCNRVQSVTFTATDRCGNFNTTTAAYTISDNTNPSITIAASNLQADCGSANLQTNFTSWLNTRGGAQATDTCNSTIFWTNNSTGIAPTGCSASQIVQFTATDSCGRSAVTTATFSIVSTSPPTLTRAAQNKTTSCGSSGSILQSFNDWLSINGNATAVDSCTDVIWTNNAVSPPSGNCNSVTVTFTASDACSPPKSIRTTATFFVVDNVNPVYNTAPQNVSFSCDASNVTSTFNQWVSSQGNSAVSDNCQVSLTLTNNLGSNPVPPTGCSGVTTARFTAADGCGNAVTATATFTVTDNTPPVIFPTGSDLTVECGNNVQQQYNSWLGSNAGLVATDSCSSVSVTNNATGTVTNNCFQQKFVLFTATDACNNQNTDISVFTVQDTTLPTISTQASDRTVECNGSNPQTDLNSWLSNQGGAVGSDNCGSVTWTNNFVALSNGCVQTATVTFTATDPCGFTAQTIATYTLQDTASPTITRQAQPVNSECDGTGNENSYQNWLDTNGGATANDACSGPSSIIWSNNGEEEDLVGCDSVTVTFTATDPCGKSVQTTATFTVIDSVGPSFTTFPQDETVECDGNGNQSDYATWVSTNAGAVVFDECAIFVQFTNDAPSTGPVTCASVTVTFVAADSCGNSNSADATYTVVDSTGPLIVTPAQDESVECDSSLNDNQLTDWLNDNAGAVAFDDCTGSNVEWTNNFLEEVVLDECSFGATVTFTASDGCGATAETTATFAVVDTQPPVLLTVAQNTTFQCNLATNPGQIRNWLLNNGGATAVDSCTTVQWTNDYESPPISCSNPDLITFTASDVCGNSINSTAYLALTDTVAPIFVHFPDDAIVGCNECYTIECLGAPGAVDACTAGIVVLHSDLLVSVDPTVALCPGNQNLARTFVAQDNCGNIVNRTQSIVIEIARSPGPCAPNQCPSCEGVISCCTQDLGQVPCKPVACNAVPCTPVDCLRVDCLPSEDCTFGTVPPAPQIGDDPEGPLPYGGGFGNNYECDPIYIYIFDDDVYLPQDDKDIVYKDIYVYYENSATSISLSFLFIIAMILAMI